MGSTFYHDLTLAEAISAEVGEGWNITDKALGAFTPDGTWQGCTWLVLEPTDETRSRYLDGSCPDRLLAVALWYRKSGDQWGYGKGVGVKVVTEDMGPGAGSIPRRIWEQRSPEPIGTYGAAWRESQAEWFERFPQVATDAVVGTEYVLEGYGRVRFEGKRQRGRSVRYLFHFLDLARPGVYALRTSEHKLGLGPVPAEVAA